MSATIIEGIKTLFPIPEQGQRFLSVNLALVDLADLSDAAKALGFKPELVQIPYRSGIQVHALLWQGTIADTPPNMDERVDSLADLINPDAICYAAGTWTRQVA